MVIKLIDILIWGIYYMNREIGVKVLVLVYIV